MDYIYARVSTKDKQSTEAQELRLISRFPSAELVTEHASGAKDRPILQALLSRLQPADRLIVAALDRLGRRTAEVITMIETLTQRGVILISDREGVDYSTPSGRLITQVLAAVAEMERSLISERTKAGLRVAKSKGKKLGAQLANKNRWGKSKTFAPEFMDRFHRLKKFLPPAALATEMQVSLSTIYTLIRRHKCQSS